MPLLKRTMILVASKIFQVNMSLYQIKVKGTNNARKDNSNILT